MGNGEAAGSCYELDCVWNQLVANANSDFGNNGDVIDQPKPFRIINSSAPTRICDNGGWTDTWFARHGYIFNMAVQPGVEVQIEVYHRDELPPVPTHSATLTNRILVQAENYRQTFAVEPGSGHWPHHPLIEAAFDLLPVPHDVSLRVNVHSAMPPSASVGTSAALAVALVAALDALTPGRKTAHELAYAAHAIETQLLKQQSGVQDQLAAAYGGINFIEMTSYPYAMVSPVHVSDAIWHELERRLLLIYLGKPHHSSQVHESVIRELEGAGPNDPRIEALRQPALSARDALLSGDLTAFGQSMIQNNDAQAHLKAELVSVEAHQVIEIAKAHGAIGWKVNGAGGAGGSITLLCNHAVAQRRALVQALCQANAAFQAIPIHLSRQGATVWEC